MKRAYKNKKASYHWSSAKNEYVAAVRPLVNRTLCSLSGLQGISFVRAFENKFRRVVLGALEGK